MTTTTLNTAPAQPNEAGVLEHLDPTALVIETNVRTEALILEAEFVDSVRMHGVLVPVLGWRATDGVVHVRAGQRRTLAAREAAIATIPVYVVRADDDSTARRVVEQLVENEHRQHLTDTDRVAAWQQLTLEGLTVATIAKRTGTKRDQVAAGLAVAASSTGGALLGEGALTFDQAALVLGTGHVLRGAPATRPRMHSLGKRSAGAGPRWTRRRLRRSGRGVWRGVSSFLPCPGLPPPRCGFRTTRTHLELMRCLWVVRKYRWQARTGQEKNRGRGEEGMGGRGAMRKWL